MNAAVPRIRVERWTSASALDRVAVADDFGAIVKSARLPATMRANLGAGGSVLAALAGETLVGYATTVPVAALSSPEAAPLDRWHDLPHALELGAIEVARAARRNGIATALLRSLQRWPDVERWILLAHAVASHWDVDGTGLGWQPYRAMLVRLLARAGFALRATDDPEVREHWLHFLAVRVGAAVPPAAVAAMVARLIMNERG